MVIKPVVAKAADLLRQLIRHSGAAIAPRCCIFCGVSLRTTEAGFCAGCYRDLPWNKTACRFCALPVASALPDGVPCATCQKEPSPFICVIAPLHYTFPVDEIIKGLKFQRHLYYQPALSEILQQAEKRLPADIDALLPVPLHRLRQMRRGFNQATELALPLQRKWRLPILHNVVRTRRTAYQSGLHAAERKQNLGGAFRLRGTVAASHVLIVDDVITTGETCRQLARLLHAAGVAQVSALAVARAAREP